MFSLCLFGLVSFNVFPDPFTKVLLVTKKICVMTASRGGKSFCFGLYSFIDQADGIES
jgi:hypothetical protein